MLKVGRVTSTKFALKVRFVAMVNCSVARLVSRLPNPSVQLVKAKPAAARAVSV